LRRFLRPIAVSFACLRFGGEIGVGIGQVAAHGGRIVGCEHPAAMRAALAVISETTKPAPRSGARRRNGASGIPDIGAKITGFGSVRLPMTTDWRREKGTAGGT